MTIDFEIQSGARFQFGCNWQKYSAQAGERPVVAAMASMQKLLQAGGSGCNEVVFRRDQEHPQP
jgi:hypothetical protein